MWQWETLDRGMLNLYDAGQSLSPSRKLFLTSCVLARLFFFAEFMQESLLCKGRRICSAEMMAPLMKHWCFFLESANMDISFLVDLSSLHSISCPIPQDFTTITTSWAQNLSPQRSCSLTSCSCLLQCGSCFTVLCVMPELVLLRGSFMHLNMTRLGAHQLPLCSCYICYFFQLKLYPHFFKCLFVFLAWNDGGSLVGLKKKIVWNIRERWARCSCPLFQHFGWLTLWWHVVDAYDTVTGNFLFVVIIFGLDWNRQSSSSFLALVVLISHLVGVWKQEEAAVCFFSSSHAPLLTLNLQGRCKLFCRGLLFIHTVSSQAIFSLLCGTDVFSELLLL